MRSSIEHSENKIVVQSGLFKTEIGPGLLKSSVQKKCILQERQRYKAEATEYVLILSFFSGVLAGKCLLNARLERSRSSLVVDTRYNLFSECSFF